MNDYHYGLATPQEVAGMSGREILQAIIDGRLPQPPISKTLSFWLVEVGDGFAAFEGEPGAHLLNPIGTVHGGWALTLIDSVAACAGHSVLPAGSGYTTIETKGNLSRPIAEDTGPRSRRRPRGVPGPEDHFLRCESALDGWSRVGARYVNAFGAGERLAGLQPSMPNHQSEIGRGQRRKQTREQDVADNEGASFRPVRMRKVKRVH